MQLQWLCYLAGMWCGKKAFDDPGSPTTTAVSLQQPLDFPQATITVTETVGVVATPVTHTYVAPVLASPTPRASPRYHPCDLNPSMCMETQRMSIQDLVMEGAQLFLDFNDNVNTVAKAARITVRGWAKVVRVFLKNGVQTSRAAFKFAKGEKLTIHIEFNAFQLLALLMCLLEVHLAWQFFANDTMQEHLKNIVATVGRGIASGSKVFWTVVSSCMLFLVYDQLKQDPVKQCLVVLISLDCRDPVIDYLRSVGFGFRSLREMSTVDIPQGRLTHGWLHRELFSTVDQLQDDGTFEPKSFTEVGVGILVGLWRFSRAAIRVVIDFWTRYKSKGMSACRWIRRIIVEVIIPPIKASVAEAIALGRLHHVMREAKKGKCPWPNLSSRPQYNAQLVALMDIVQMDAFQLADVLVENRWLKKDRTYKDLTHSVYNEIYQHALCRGAAWHPYWVEKGQMRRHEIMPKELQLEFFPYRCPCT